MSGSVAAVVAEHYNQIEEKGIEARIRSRIYHLRNFNNWIKSMLINQYVIQYKADFKTQSLCVLDIGAGKGGDLMKWKKNGITYLVCADIAETSIQQCRQRYADMSERHVRQRERGDCFKAEFIVSDFTKDRLKDQLSDPEINFGIVSCQFAFHYCFESLAQAKKMIRNVSENLEPGGFFIGTIPDAYDIMRRLEDSIDRNFGNDIFSVKFESKEETFPLFGAKYDFQLEGVVNCPEFLVYFPTFVKLAEEYGDMELVFSKRFEDYYEQMSKSQEGQQLLTRMMALETYPPLQDRNAKLVGGDDDYFHAQKKLDEIRADKSRDPQDEPRLGTLSQSEWEVICMYLVFAFRKKGVPKKKNCDKETPECDQDKESAGHE